MVEAECLQDDKLRVGPAAAEFEGPFVEGADVPCRWGL